VPTPDYLLALKVLASRVDRDAGDITFLARICGFTTADEVLDCVQRWFPTRTLQPKSQFLVEELFPPPDPDPPVPTRSAAE
jgi:hypothetical protein